MTMRNASELANTFPSFPSSPLLLTPIRLKTYRRYQQKSLSQLQNSFPKVDDWESGSHEIHVALDKPGPVDIMCLMSNNTQNGRHKKYRA